MIFRKLTNSHFIKQFKNAMNLLKKNRCYFFGLEMFLTVDVCRFDSDPAKSFKVHEGVNSVNNEPFKVDVGYERFLGPEIFFHPEFSNPDYQTSISEVVDRVIQSAPIDNRLVQVPKFPWPSTASNCSNVNVTMHASLQGFRTT